MPPHHGVAKPTSTANPICDRERISVERIDNVEQTLVPQRLPVDACAELRIGRVRKRESVVHEGKYRPCRGR